MKRNTLLALVLGLAMIFGTCTTVFAGYEGIETLPQIKDEVDAEAVAMALVDETADGGYGLVDTKTLKAWKDNNEDLIIIDTMGEANYNKRHIPGAIYVWAPLRTESYEKSDQADLLKKVKDLSGTKKVTKYYNKKTKKWTTKKIKGAKKKTVTQAVKNKAIVVYCGYTKCTRSHMAAKYLVENGYTNVYRYPGGISAWKDASLKDSSYVVEGTDI